MKILLIIPPFTQLNTPYPSTAYLKPVLEQAGHEVRQIDLGIKAILEIFSKSGLKKLYEILEKDHDETEYGSLNRFKALKEQYLMTIDQVISFLQGENDSAAYNILSGKWLPEGERQEYDLEKGLHFSDDSVIDKARHKATLYLEEIGDIITNFCDTSFGFSRYAEKISLSPPEFTGIKKIIDGDLSFSATVFTGILKNELAGFSPDLCGLTIPFPGNLVAALICSRYIKMNYVTIKTVFGGGYVNTELRNLNEPDFFEYVDFVTLDDGETPILSLAAYLNGEIKQDHLIRTYLLDRKNQVEFIDSPETKNIHQHELPAPDYTGLMNQSYLSILPVTNRMHRLWSEGKWNKMTLAHGCYWHRCAFCDTSLDYIKRYKPDSPKSVVDKIEKLVKETGNRSFHFVDEAAPPALLKNMAIELLRREISITWWTNIRFEKSFKPDLCRLLAKSGCIAISGGLEVASDRLLNVIQKGVTVEQVATVAASLNSAGIMVHTYLMYGFPGQNEQEIINALENVRQLFKEGLINSAFWHQFALTAHSPVGLNPESYGVEIRGPEMGKFARNDLIFNSDSDFDPSIYSTGLKAALANFMINREFNRPLNQWFTFRTPKTTIKRNYIKDIRSIMNRSLELHNNSQFIWIGAGIRYDGEFIYLHDVDGAEKIKADKREWNFLSELIKICNIKNDKKVTTLDVEMLSGKCLIDLDQWLSSELFSACSAYGLIII